MTTISKARLSAPPTIAAPTPLTISPANVSSTSTSNSLDDDEKEKTNYDDIFDRLDDDVPALVIRTTTDVNRDYEDSLLTGDTSYFGDEPHNSLPTKATSQQRPAKTQVEREFPEMDDRYDEEGNLKSHGEKIDIEQVNFYDLEANMADGTPFDFKSLKGKYVMITNVASLCIMTWQMKALEKLYAKYKDQGFEVLGFPANDFFEEWMSSQTAGECYKKLWRANFKIMQKVRVNGKKQHDVFRYLKTNKRGLWGMKAVKWNFEKFLVDREGNIVKRYSTLKFPQSIMNDIDELLAKEKMDALVESGEQPDAASSTDNELEEEVSTVKNLSLNDK